MREKPRGEARTRTSRYAVRIRFPSRMTFCMSGLRVSRCCRGKPKPSSGAGVLVWQLDGEALAALSAATAENCTSPLGFHARAKSVRLDPALVAGTIRRLTHVRLQKRYERSCGAVGKAIQALGIGQARESYLVFRTSYIEWRTARSRIARSRIASRALVYHKCRQCLERGPTASKVVRYRDSPFAIRRSHFDHKNRPIRLFDFPTFDL